MKNILFILCFILFYCKDETLPKPKGYLRLDYPKSAYQKLNKNCPYEFEYNSLAQLKNSKDCSFEIFYPKMKATVYVTYKPINNNLNALLKDAQKLTYEHAIKADEIFEQPYINPYKKTYGMYYQIGGNAATNAQFYVTDSTKNFIVASMYFYTKPNYDSILPAAEYVKKDMKHIIETLSWK